MMHRSLVYDSHTMISSHYSWLQSSLSLDSTNTVPVWPDDDSEQRQPTLSSVLARSNATRMFPSTILLHSGTYDPLVIRADAVSSTGKISIQALTTNDRVVIRASSQSPPVSVPSDIDPSTQEGPSPDWKVILFTLC